MKPDDLRKLIETDTIGIGHEQTRAALEALDQHGEGEK